ncbi:MAG: hypothetical protein IJJ33_17000 [Victivallales bacterium]|nr:hypothetical protein [Victivallales bacterium]
MRKVLSLIILGTVCCLAVQAMYLEIVPGADGNTQFGAVSEVTGRLSIRDVTHTVRLEGDGMTVLQKSPLPPAPMKLTQDDIALIEITPPGAARREFTIRPSEKESRLDGGFWTWERHLTWGELGVTSACFDEEWRIQICRQYQNQSEKAYYSYPEAARVVFRRQGSNFSFMGFGPRWKKSGYEITWTTAGTVKVNAQIVSIENPRSFNQVISQAPGVLRSIMNNSTERTLKMEWLNPGTQSLIGKRELTWLLVKDGKMAGPDYVDPDPPLVLKGAFYPHKNILCIDLNCQNKSKLQRFKDVVFILTDVGGKTIMETPATQTSEAFTAQVGLPQLEVGKYTLQAKAGDALLECGDHFHVEKFAWQNKGYGMARLVVPPFKPLDYKDDEIKGAFTSYRMGGILWDEIRADGKNLLRSPVRLTGNGSEFKIKARRILEKEHDRAVVENDLEMPGWKLVLRQEYDYDGMCRLILDFTPQGLQTLDGVDLEFPLDAGELKMFHSLGDGMRRNKCGFLPEGDGTLWRADKPAIGSLPGFRPYIWVGGIHRGFCWFAESDEGWGRDEGANAVSLERRGDCSTLAVHLFSSERAIDKPFSIEMGVQPTPVKKVQQPYRELTGTFFTSWVPDSSKTLAFNGSGKFIGQRVDDGLNVPPDNDWSFVDFVLQKQWKTRAEVEKVASEYLKKHSLSDDNWSRWGGKATPDSAILLRMWQGARFHKTADYFFRYFNPRALCPSWPEREMYASQWFLDKGAAARTFNDEYCCHPDDAYIDFTLHHALPYLERNWTGIYYDNFYDLVMKDPLAGTSRDTPRKTPYWPMFAMRALVRRTAVMLCERDIDFKGLPAVMIHMTDCNVVPWLSFAGITLDWEMHYGDTPYPERFSDAYILTHSLGTQTGCIPFVLLNSTGASGAKATDSLLSLSFSYDLLCQTDAGLTKTDEWKKVQNYIRNFGYGREDTVVWPGWSEDNPVKLSPGNTRCTTVRRKDGKTLLLLGNRGDEETVRITLAAEQASEALSGARLSIGRTLNVEMPKYGWKMIVLGAK